MYTSPRELECVPIDQLQVQARCTHPSGAFIEFPRQDIEQSIPSRFEQQVAKHPHRLALKTRTHRLTYTELNQFSNHIAGSILPVRDQRARPIALLLEQGAPLIAAILGVLKAGKIYVPLDPAHPKSRLESTLDDVRAELIITDNKNLSLCNELSSNRSEVLNVSTLDSHISAENPGLSLSPDSLAYIFYTSGSTGRPKGVVDNHRNVLHNIMRYTNSLHICLHDRLTLLQSCSFSGSVSSLFAGLLNGAAVFPYDIRKDGPGMNLARWLIREGITIYHSVPALFRSFLIGDSKFPEIRVIRLEGDAASERDVELYKKHFESCCILVNGLGATETGLTRQHFIDKKTSVSDGTVPVGYAVKDMRVLLLDDDGKESANRVGEIAIRSRYLSPGYWQNPELTRLCFLSDPAGGAERLYKTGDLGRMRPDGCLEYLSRKEFQVQIKGVRVEIAEVEAALRDLASVSEAVVASREDKHGDQRLVAYLVSKTERPVSVSRFRRLLLTKLPDHMVPSAFVTLDALPLDPNGKVDRKNLPQPSGERPLLDDPYVSPRNELEHKLIRIWEKVLGVQGIGIKDDFFDLGGDSLLAVSLVTRLQNMFGKSVAGSSLFQASNIEQQANILCQRESPSPHGLLVAINPDGFKRPFFAIHACEGEVLFYKDLARHLGVEQPFYALTAKGLYGEEIPHTRIEEMAADYANEMRKVQPDGPFRLGGAGVGGRIAVETAQQLIAQSQEIILLVIMDDWLPEAGSSTVNRYYRQLVYALRQGLLLDTLIRMGANIKNKLRRKVDYVFADPQARRMLNVEDAIERASRSYVPEVYPGRIVYFSSETRAAKFSLDSWRTLAGEGLDVREVSGDHLEMLKEPHVKGVAEQLKACLDNSPSSRNSSSRGQSP